MAQRTRSSGTQGVAQLKEENRKLKEEIAKLQKDSVKSPKHKRSIWRAVLFVFVLGLAGAILTAGNVLFWTGRTLTETDRYMAAVEPLLDKPEIRTALADKFTNTVFENVNVEELAAEALPPRAAFLAGPISGQVKGFVNEQANNILANPDFQQFWNDTNRRAHERYINFLRNYEGDGSINIDDVYARLSIRLSERGVTFLEGKQLPENIGSIEVVNRPMLPTAHWIVKNLTLLRVLSLIIFFSLTAFAIWLARDRRKTFIRIMLLYAAFMFTTLVALRIVENVVVTAAESTYQPAFREIWSVMLSSLILQTRAILLLGLVGAFGAWITGSSKAAMTMRDRLNQLFAGKLHTTLFINGENSISRFFGKYRSVLVGLTVACLMLIMLTL